MDVEKGLKIAEELLNRTLKQLEVLIFQESWKGRQGKKYKEIADIYGCELGTVNDAASDLWQSLSKALGKKVIKSNFRRELENQARSHSPEVPQPQAQAQEEAVSVNPDFVGREEDIDRLTTLIISRNAKVIGIYAKGGVGKTTLARHFFKKQGLETWKIEFPIQSQDITSVEKEIKYFLESEFKDEPEPDFGIMLQQVKKKLQAKKIGVFIDNLEPALDDKGKFIEEHRRYVELLRVLANPDVQSITLITSRERLNESKVSVEAYKLPGLDEIAWQDFFRSHNIDTNFPAFLEMHEAYEGNAKAMEILYGVISQEPYKGDLEAYWQENKGDLLIERELEDLVSSQFNRLEKTDPDAYKLLYRLGVYRYQEIAQVPSVALACLLWDVPEERRKRVINSLQNRFLVESQKGEFWKVEYWLHPVIRAEAVRRLKLSGESTEDLLLSMKQQIDALLALDNKLQIALDNKLQNFLTWLNQKSILVLQQWNFSQVPYKPKLATVRAIYFTRPPELDLDRNRDLAYAIGFDLSYDYYLARTDDIEFALERVLNLAIKNELPTGAFYTAFYTGSNCTPELKQALQKLKEQLPNPDKSSEIFDWWQSYGQAWTGELRAVMIQHCIIGHDWQFSSQQKELLQQYYEANKLLVDCLNNASDTVRSHIEDTLLLPISEIKQLTPQN